MINPIYGILSNYRADTAGVRQNLHRLLTHGTLGHTGKLLIYSIDQGFEVGPDQVFGEFSHGYDPWFHFKLACAGKLSALAAPVGIIETSVDQFLGKIPLILKVNSNNNMMAENTQRRYQSITASVDDALRLGCIGIGFTIYPGSEDSYTMFEELAEISREAKAKGLIVMVWAYPKGPDMTKADETCIDATGYAIHIASLLGAHIIKAKLPSAKIWNPKLEPQFKKNALESLPHRLHHVLRCALSRKRIVLFSGGEKVTDAEFLETIHAIAEAGGGGSVIGRNFFQRTFNDGLSLIENVANIYKTHAYRDRPYEDQCDGHSRRQRPEFQQQTVGGFEDTAYTTR